MAALRVVVLLLFFQSLLSWFLGAWARDPRMGIGGTTWVGGDIFLQGKYMEVAINPGGGFGNRAPPAHNVSWGGSSIPTGFHPSPTAYGGQRMSVVVDYDKNGWTNGNPPQSGDFVLEGDGIPETGWHLSFTSGDYGTFKFNQMPMVSDDDDQDLNYIPPRGCSNCKNGLRNGCVKINQINCWCSYGEPSNFWCFGNGGFLRWDITTQSFAQIATGDPTKFHVRYVGKASAHVFPTNQIDILWSGRRDLVGEEITITKDIYFNYGDTFLVETYFLQNTGNTTLSNIQMMWHLYATPEDTTFNPHYNASTSFNNYNSIPLQGGHADPRVLVQSRSPTLNITASIGIIDRDAKGWYVDDLDWEETYSYRPYSAQLVFDDWNTADAEYLSSPTETYGQKVIAIGTQKPPLAPGGTIQFNVFHAFTEDAIPDAFAAITIGCDGVLGSGLVYDTCNVCGGDGRSCVPGCDGVIVCGGNNSTCEGCDGKFYETGRQPVYDVCGICGGDDSTCCPQGVDVCGVCGGNGSTCVGCDGISRKVPATYDSCGICGGAGYTCPGAIQYDTCQPCSTCTPCDAASCLPCDQPCGAFHGYGSSDLDFLIYRFEVTYNSNSDLGYLTGVLTDQLPLVKTTPISLNSYIDTFKDFEECVHLIDGRLRDSFGLNGL